MGQTACRTDTLLFQKLVLICANLFSAIRANTFSMGPISVSMRPQAPRQFIVMTRQSFAHLHQLFSEVESPSEYVAISAQAIIYPPNGVVYAVSKHLS